MNEKVQDFRGPSDILIGNKAERPEKNTSSEQQPFHWGPRFHIGCRGLGRFQDLDQETKCEGKALEVTMALLKGEQESRCFDTVSETRRTQH